MNIFLKIFSNYFKQKCLTEERFNFDFIAAKIGANLQFDLLQDYQFAIQHIDKVKHASYSTRLVEYQAFLSKHVCTFVLFYFFDLLMS